MLGKPETLSDNVEQRIVWERGGGGTWTAITEGPNVDLVPMAQQSRATSCGPCWMSPNATVQSCLGGGSRRAPFFPLVR